MHEFGIIFLHHNVDEVTNNNLLSFRRHNPDAPIVAISSGEPFKGGFAMKDFHVLAGLWRDRVQGDWKNRSHDFLVYSWYASKNDRIECKRWFIVEWDTYCNMPVPEFCKHVWDFDVAGPSVRLMAREPEWYWFETIRTLPKEMQQHATGIVPFSCTLVSDRALKAIVQNVPWSTLGRTNTDLRFATAAAVSGYKPVANPLCGDNVTWQPLPEETPLTPSIWHPVKWKV